MSDAVLGSILQRPDVSAAESGEHSGASGDGWQGEEASGKRSYLSIALEAFQYLTTNMAVQMCING